MTLLPRLSREAPTMPAPPAAPSTARPAELPDLGLSVGVEGGACGSSVLTAGDMWLSPDGMRGRIWRGTPPGGPPRALTPVTGVGGGARGISPVALSLHANTHISVSAVHDV